MKKKTNEYLIEYCLAQLGKPYWFGTFGQKATKKLYEEKKKQYPKYYTAKNYPEQYGERVHDCAGLIKGAYWSDTPTSTPKYDAKTDYGATAFYNNCTKKGKIATFDKVDGRLVFKGNDKSKSHVGVYYKGYVLEAKGHAYGVVKTKFNAKSWQYWGQSNLFEEVSDLPYNGQPAKDDKEPLSGSGAANKPSPVANNGSSTSGKPYSIKYQHEYRVTAEHGLNVRKIAGKSSNHEILATIPQGKIVSCNGEYEVVGSSKELWLNIVYTNKNGIKYQGYSCAKYLVEV